MTQVTKKSNKGGEKSMKHEMKLTKVTKLQGENVFIFSDGTRVKSHYEDYLRIFEEKLARFYDLIEALTPMLNNLHEWCNKNRIDWDSLMDEMKYSDLPDDLFGLYDWHLPLFVDALDNFVFDVIQGNYWLEEMDGDKNV